MKIGLIVDGGPVPEYVRDLASWGRGANAVQVTHLIVQRLPGDRSKKRGKFAKLLASLTGSGLRQTVRAALWSLIAKLEALRLKRRGDYRGFLTSHSLDDLELSTIDVDIDVSKSGLVYRYPKEALAEIEAAGLDALIRCGSGILRGGILDVCRHGVLSFHHGDNRVNRGSPAGFWEVYREESTTGFVIQRLTEELDGGDVLFTGNIPTQSFFALNRAKLYRKASIFLQRLLTSIASNGAQARIRDDAPYYNRLYRSPTVGEQLAYLWRRYAVAGARRVARKLAGRDPHWGVAYLPCADWRKAVLYKARRLPKPASGFLADPFLACRAGRTCLFVEEFDNAAGKAHISAFELGGDAPQSRSIVLNEPFHLSFPFLFEFEGELFMCPESAGNRDIRIYRCEDFPSKWTLHSTPFESLSAVDTMIFPHRGHWWLLTNIDSAEIGDRSELHVFRADHPLTGRWQPHPKNPVLFDSTLSRNGGLLFSDGRVFRISQRHGFGTYGSEMLVREIISLSLSDYEERDYCVIEPGFFDGLKGTHTFAAATGYVAFDYLG